MLGTSSHVCLFAQNYIHTADYVQVFSLLPVTVIKPHNPKSLKRKGLLFGLLSPITAQVGPITAIQATGWKGKETVSMQ